jgi:hypothetical protein
MGASKILTQMSLRIFSPRNLQIQPLRRWQFSIRKLMGVIAIVAVSFGIAEALTADEPPWAVPPPRPDPVREEIMQRIDLRTPLPKIICILPRPDRGTLTAPHPDPVAPQ